MQNKTVVVTGSSSGLGKETAKILASKGAKIIMVCHNKAHGEIARQEIINESNNPNVTLEICDLSLGTSVHECGLLIREKYTAIDVLVNNAGAIFGAHALNEEGLEATFALNQMGYFRFTHYMLDLLKKGTDKRIVSVASFARKIPWDDLQLKNSTYKQLNAYSLSKLYNIYFTRHLAQLMTEQKTGITVNCVHPGTVYSNFGKSGSKLFYLLFKLTSPFYDNVQKGAQMAIHMASSPEVKNIHGAYYAHMKEGKLTTLAQNDQNALRMWDNCMQIAKFNVYGLVEH